MKYTISGCTKKNIVAWLLSSIINQFDQLINWTEQCNAITMYQFAGNPVINVAIYLFFTFYSLSISVGFFCLLTFSLLIFALLFGYFYLIYIISLRLDLIFYFLWPHLSTGFLNFHFISPTHFDGAFSYIFS